MIRIQKLKVLILGYVWPEPQSSAAGLRSWNLIHSFERSGLNPSWEIHYASPSQENEASLKLREHGLVTHSIRANDSSFDCFVHDLNPDFVIFDRFVMEEQFGWRIEEQCPNAVRILDTQDLHFLRRGRESALQRGLSLEEIKQLHFDLVSGTTLRELGSILRCDQTLLLSDFEINLLQEKFQIDPKLLFLSRFHYPPHPSCPAYDERSDFMMIGNFRHPPNADGIKWFREEVWPLIRKELPATQVFIYGAYPPKALMQLTDKSAGFYVVGPVPDQFETFRKHRVNLAPLRFGAGIKGKITDGWWTGTPVIATSIGAEGMCESLPWGGAIADKPQEFAEHAITLYLNQELWKECQQYGYQILSQLYSQERNSMHLINHLIQVQNQLSSLRNKNLIGKILRHHFNKSTKYFSKWIESKNLLNPPTPSSRMP